MQEDFGKAIIREPFLMYEFLILWLPDIVPQLRIHQCSLYRRFEHAKQRMYVHASQSTVPMNAENWSNRRDKSCHCGDMIRC